MGFCEEGDRGNDGLRGDGLVMTHAAGVAVPPRRGDIQGLQSSGRDGVVTERFHDIWAQSDR
jgi:hypothetical protein